MQKGDTLHLLVSCESQAQLESCIALFRDAGWTTRAHRVSSLRDLSDMLRDPQWDVVIASEKHPEVAPAEALAALAAAPGAPPCIVRAAGAEPALAIEWLRAGARDVVPAEHGERLLFAALREIAARRERRELAELRTQYEEIAHRVELLLAASQDAIAYVVDGMHVHANTLYAELFGYPDVDELASVPLVDLIAPAGQQRFKEALRSYRDNPDRQTAIEFTGTRADGSEFAGQLALSTASFEGEPCMQVMVRAAPAASAAPTQAAAGTAAPAQGLNALTALIAGAAGGHLLLLGVDGYAQHCRTLGVSAANRLVDELGAFIATSCGWPEPLRAGDATLAVHLPAGDTAAIQAQARSAVEKVAAHIHEAGTRSLTCAISVLVCPLEGASDASAAALVDRAWGALLAAAQQAQSLRGADPARVGLLALPAAVAAAAGADGRALEEALGKGAFRLLFQPIVSLRGDTSEYYEVQPEHIPTSRPAAAWLAESGIDDGASTELDHWCISAALESLARHRARHPETRLILPVGTGSLLDPDFATWLAAALRNADLPGECIAIQLPHPAVSASLKQASELGERLRALGCQVAIADVNAANNPLPDLMLLRPQFARMDPALADALGDSEATNNVLKPLIEALHKEQIISVMPGVAGAGVMAVLWQLGVNFIQGDYLQAPMPDMHYEFTDLA